MVLSPYRLSQFLPLHLLQLKTRDSLAVSFAYIPAIAMFHAVLSSIFKASCTSTFLSQPSVFLFPFPSKAILASHYNGPFLLPFHIIILIFCLSL